MTRVVVEARRKNTAGLSLGGTVIPHSDTGDPDCEFKAIFLEHYQHVFGLLVRVVGDRARAEELANEVFWKLSRQPVVWLLTNRIGGWLYRAAVHAGIDALRADANRRRHERAAALRDDTSAGFETGPLNELMRDEQSRMVRRVLATMKPGQAQLLLLRAEGSSYKELSEVCEIATSGVGTLLNRAEAEFRRRYLKLTGEKEKDI